MGYNNGFRSQYIFFIFIVICRFLFVLCNFLICIVWDIQKGYFFYLCGILIPPVDGKSSLGHVREDGLCMLRLYHCIAWSTNMSRGISVDIPPGPFHELLSICLHRMKSWRWRRRRLCWIWTLTLSSLTWLLQVLLRPPTLPCLRYKVSEGC